jgi:hypothetical protein
MALGRERRGQYKGMYNLCCGSGELSDTNKNGELCYLEILKREFFEEFKTNTPFTGGVFDSYFKNSNGNVRYFIHNRTPIFLAMLPKGSSRKTIKMQMQIDNANQMLPWDRREMDDYEYIRLDSAQQVEGHNVTVSPFADAVRRKINTTKL